MAAGLTPSDLGKKPCFCGGNHWKPQCTQGGGKQVCEKINRAATSTIATEPLQSSSKTPFNPDGTCKSRWSRTNMAAEEIGRMIVPPDILDALEHYNLSIVHKKYGKESPWRSALDRMGHSYLYSFHTVPSYHANPRLLVWFMILSTVFLFFYFFISSSVASFTCFQVTVNFHFCSWCFSSTSRMQFTYRSACAPRRRNHHIFFSVWLDVKLCATISAFGDARARLGGSLTPPNLPSNRVLSWNTI